MSNSFYNHGAFPSTGSAATSASMRAELDLVAAGFDKMPTLAGNANKFVIVNSTGTGLTQTDVLPAFTVTDTDFTVQDDGDNTRKFQFNAGSITTGNTRVYVMPDLDTTLVGTNVTQTLTNKTLTAPVIATIVNTGTLTLPTSTDTLIGRNTTDTLTNKTLTNPVIGTIVNTGTLTLPTSTDTLVGRQTTDTLTNKTISGASNTLSNIANGSLSNSSVVIGSSTLSLGGTLTTLAGVTISGASNTLSNIANASLTNSSITINGSTVALGSSVTVTATATNALTIGNGLSGTSYNGSSAVTIAINTGVTADLSTAQTFSNKTISGSANTLTNIANASLTNSAITIGSTAISLGATSLTIAGLTSASATTLISTGNQATSVAISAIGHSSGTVTVTTSTAHGLTTGDTASIDGVADYTFCGVYTVTVSNANVFTYSQTASGVSSSGGFSTKLSGTWGLYAGGTGPSLANGPVMINASSQLPALRVTQGGSGYALIVEDAANPDTSAFIISNAGDLAINTNKFTVAAASGNTLVAGTLDATGNFNVNTNKFSVVAASGNTTIAGTTSLNGNVTFATDATYDIGASGATRPRDLFLSRNLTVGGTLTLAGGVNLNGNVTIGDASTDTLTINSTITSNLIFTDNTYDIGASGATRPRNLYLAGNAVIAGSTTLSNGTANSILYLNGSKAVSSSGNLTYDGTNVLLSSGYFQAVNSTITALLRQTSSTSYTSLRMYNDLNTSARSLEINYAGSAYSGSLITGSPSGEQATIATVGAYPLVLGTSNAQRLGINATGYSVFGTGSASFPVEITINAASASQPMLAVNPVTGTNAALMYFNNSGAGSFYIGRSNSVGTGSSSTLSAYDSFIWNSGLQNLSIGTNNTLAIQVDTSQRVAINNTTNPSYRLFVTGGTLGAVYGSMITAGTNGNIFTTSDLSPTGSNTSFGGIGFTSSPGADFFVGKKTVNTTPYLDIRSGTTSLMQFDASGNAAMSASPDSSYGLLLKQDSAVAQIRILPTTSSRQSIIELNNSGAGAFNIGRSNSAGQGSGATIGSYDSFVWNTGLQQIYFGTNNTTAMYITTGQYVYISSFLETPVFQVVSATNGQGNMKFQCTNAGTLGTGYVGINAYTSGVFGLGTASSTNLPLEMYVNGSVGARLSVGQGNSGQRLLSAGYGVTASGTNNSGGLSAGMGNFGTNGRNPSVSISGVYNSTAGVPQFVSNWASGGAWALGPDTGSNDSYLRLGLWASDSDGFYWTGTYVNLKVSTLTQTSDYRIKENVRLYEQDALAVLRLFAPKRFNKIVHDDPTVEEAPIVRDEIGYLAHEVQEHIPELVTGVKDAVDAQGVPIIQGMDYDRMGPVLHRALLQLEDKFNAYVASHP